MTATYPTFVPEHGYLFISLLVLSIQLLICALCAGRIRNQVFTKKFMEDNFGEIHFRETRNSTPVGGFPDMGCGRYSDKLTYYDWFRLNNSQRNHYNYLENFSVILLTLLIGGIYYPLYSTIFAVGIFASRILYGFYLTPKGVASAFRRTGEFFSNLFLFGSLVVAFISAYQLTKLGSELSQEKTIATPSSMAS